MDALTMPDHINRPLNTPRIPGGNQPFSLRRSSFLGSDQRCYFGPGQPPNAAPEPGIVSPVGDPDGSEAELPYSPPTEWPQAGMLLRVPQCVYLSVLMPDYNRTFPYLFASSGDNGGFWTPYSYVGSIPPIYKEEYGRLKSVFDEAKATIESIRPGRTFVMNVDWLPPGWEVPHFTNLHYAVRDRGCFHMLAPPADTDPYFGVDFLHVYCGAKAYDSVHGFPDHFYSRVIADNDPTQPVDDFHHQAAMPRVTAAYPNFRGYAVKLYGIDTPYTPWPPWVDVVISPVFAGNRSIQHDLDVFNSQQRAAIDGFNANFLDVRTNNNNFLAASAELLSGLGFTYEGGTSTITAESIVASIADHFRFDPSTGKDVG